jgi:chemotaxis family two-component system sensor kinase Cph1
MDRSVSAYGESQVLKRETLDRDAYKRLTTGDLDELPYGIIVVDPTGVVVAYNRAEAKATGFARERVVGRNFFSDVAPCTQVKMFQGRFERFVAQKATSVEPFEFVFPFAGAPQRVSILFYRDPTAPDRISIIVRREEDAA